MDQKAVGYGESDQVDYEEFENNFKTNRKCSKQKNVVKLGSREHQILWKHPAKKYSGPAIPSRSKEILDEEFTLCTDFMHNVLSVSEESVLLQGEKSFFFKVILTKL